MVKTKTLSVPAPRAAAAFAQASSPHRSAVTYPARAASLAGGKSTERQRERRAATVSTRASSSTFSSSSSSSTSSSLLAPNAARLKTLSDCGLRISVYPPFSYDASGGGAQAGTIGESEESENGGGKSPLSFDPRAVSIPALEFRTTKFLGLPLPPGFRIEIEPLKLTGWIRRGTGEVSLDFEARFLFTAFGLYAPPPLFVSATLTTGEARSKSRSASNVRLSGRGEALDNDGRVSLSGVAVVEPVGDFFLDSFLMLPAECLAELKAELELGKEGPL